MCQFYFNKERNVYLCHVSPSGPTDVRESVEAVVGGDGAQCGAENSGGAGQRQESQGTVFDWFVPLRKQKN